MSLDFVQRGGGVMGQVQTHMLGHTLREVVADWTTAEEVGSSDVKYISHHPFSMSVEESQYLAELGRELSGLGNQGLAGGGQNKETFLSASKEVGVELWIIIV